MTLYPKIVRSVLHPLDLWRIGEASELRYLREFEKSQYCSPEKIHEIAFDRLKRMLVHAARHCDYYKNSFQRYNLDPKKVQSFAELASYPILEKRDIQQHATEMIADDQTRQELIRDQTGGSTGSPIAYYYSRERKTSRSAATRRHNRWAAFEVGDKYALVWGASRDIPQKSLKNRLRNAVLDRSLVLDTSHITEAKMLAFNAALKKFRPRVLVAYARSITFLAKFLQSINETPYQPNSIITSAEVLESADRTLVENVFGCPVFNRYGCREFSVVASECLEHHGMHIMSEGLYLETVHGNRLTQPGEIGELLVTDLLNDAMPMIRYRIGDMAALDNRPCACGRGLPLLQKVAGRVTDFIVGADGRFVSGVFLATYVVARRPSLRQVQLRQEKAGEILYKILRRNGDAFAKQDSDYLIDETRRYVGSDTKVAFEFVDEMPPETSGKQLFCRSNAAPDFLNGSH
jgi:phenylacetate-CoA ligase